MKEISEENQWRIFELLEGNLSQEEQLQLLAEIDKQSELKDFYHSLKQTYLPAEKVEFTHKHTLLKSSIGVINFRSYLKYAAAAAVIGVTGYIQFFKIAPPIKVNQTTVLSPLNAPPKSNIPHKKNESQIQKSVAIHLPTNPKSANTNNIKPLKTFNTKEFNPSTKLIDENQFLNQLLENRYLSNNEKKDMMLKWLLLNSNFQQEQPIQGNIEVPVEVKVVNQDILSPAELEDQELNEIWVKEAKQMLKKGQIPKVKLVSTKKEKKWLPKFELEIQTETTSLVKNLIE